MKTLFLDADGTIWYVGDEYADGYQQPLDRLCIDPNLKILISELSCKDVTVWIVSFNEPGTVERAVEYLKLTDQVPLDRISCNWRDKGERIREIMSKNGIEKGLFVGDRVSDYQASLAAKIEGRIIKRRFNERYWPAGPTISSLLDILPILDAL